jgi:hypothetical protein
MTENYDELALEIQRAAEEIELIRSKMRQSRTEINGLWGRLVSLEQQLKGWIG